MPSTGSIPNVDIGGGNLWQTPGWVVDLVHAIKPIVLDPCSAPNEPTGARVSFQERDDGLSRDWREAANGGLCYVNPPFGRGLIARWSEKIIVEAARGCEVLSLVRSDTSTRWAHALIASADLVAFPPRIRFAGAKGSPNFGVMFTYHGSDPDPFAKALGELGPVVFPRRRNHV